MIVLGKNCLCSVCIVLGTLLTSFFNPINALAEEEAGQSTIAYRLLENKTLHFDNGQKASEHLAAVRELGCEVAPAAHEGHNDVTYRCPKWRALTVASDELAHQWEEWLHAAGFETLHGHDAEHDHEHGHEENANHAADPQSEHSHEHKDEHEHVEFRAAGWVTLPPQDGVDHQELITIAKALGCEVKEAQQDSGPTLAVRCMEWKVLELQSHEATESWEKWLIKAGFEVKHEHEAE